MNKTGLLKDNAVYQIYPISFKDSDGDGKGDLKGIISRLDYIADLGFKLVWLSPIYSSPMLDMGYDISDYKNINPMFGTMDDFDLLIKEADKRGIKIIMDLVINHTSSKHRWFQEALKDPESPYRKYYYFRQGKGKNHRLPPNNWTTTFTGSAWTELPNEPGMFYLHLYSEGQPDLDFHNPQVIQEVEDIMKFWLDKGVYGFRCDVISEIYKESLADGKRKSLSKPIGCEHFVATDGCHKVLKKLNKDVISKRDEAILIGECYGITSDQGEAFLDDELNTIFNFDIAFANGLLSSKPNTKKIKNTIIEWQNKVSYNGNYLENHDQHRAVGKYVRADRYPQSGSKMLLTMLYTLKGACFIYMGQELGLTDYKNLNIEDSHDIVSEFLYKLVSKFLPKTIAWKIARHFGRDDARYPFPFDNTDGYGFSKPTVKPWQKYYEESDKLNAVTLMKDPDSPLNYIKKLNAFRREYPVLGRGDIKFYKTNKNLFIYERYADNSKLLIVLNMSDKKRKIPKKFNLIDRELVLSNYSDINEYLRPYESRIYKIK